MLIAEKVTGVKGPRRPVADPQTKLWICSSDLKATL